MSGPVANSFGGWASDYDRYRPHYPSAVFDAIVSRLELPDRPRVVDLGAGTGLATFAMTDRGWIVSAVEPGRQMLDVLSRRAEARGVDVRAVEAPAEVTGLPDASADLAVAAQAFHWFDRPRAVAEMARLVRPSGGVALFWNVRDPERSAFVADYERLTARFFGDAGIGQYLERGREAERTATRAAFAAVPQFAEPEYTELTHEIEMGADDFVGMAFTASYVRSRPTGDQERFRDEIWGLLHQHGLDRKRFIVPYVVHLWIAVRKHQ